MRVDPRSFYADLFSKPAAGDVVRNDPPPLARTRPAPADQVAIKALPAPQPPAADAATPAPAVPAPANAADAADAATKPAPAAASPVKDLIGDVDVHHLTPRQMANLSFDLYTAGAISFDDYAALAFQPELHPEDFNRTIGALTGERAAPDRPRDFVRLWEDRADFQRRHNAARDDLVKQDERIAAVLRQIDAPTNVVV